MPFGPITHSAEVLRSPAPRYLCSGPETDGGREDFGAVSVENPDFRTRNWRFSQLHGSFPTGSRALYSLEPFPRPVNSFAWNVTQAVPRSVSPAPVARSLLESSFPLNFYRKKVERPRFLTRHVHGVQAQRLRCHQGIHATKSDIPSDARCCGPRRYISRCQPRPRQCDIYLLPQWYDNEKPEKKIKLY